MKIKYALIKYF